MGPKNPGLLTWNLGHFHFFQLWSTKQPIVKRIIQKALGSEKCKKILPQSEAAKTTSLKQ